MPIQDAPVVERMKLAGAIPLTRKNLPEFGLRIHTDNPLRGLTRNPWDSVRTVRGSSGGDDEALARGMSPVGLGNDIGGSLRNPACCSGLATIKATIGRIPWVAMLTLAKTLDSFLHRLVCARAVFAFKNQPLA